MTSRMKLLWYSEFRVELPFIGPTKIMSYVYNQYSHTLKFSVNETKSSKVLINNIVKSTLFIDIISAVLE